MSLADDILNEHSQRLAVLHCDLHPVADDLGGRDAWSIDGALDPFDVARDVAARFGGLEERSDQRGWTATFDSTVDALLCAQALAALLSRRAGVPSLSGGVSAGEVTRNSFGIGGSPVREAVALCRQARSRQVVVADPLPMVVGQNSSRSLASAPTGDGLDPPLVLVAAAAASPATTSGRALRLLPSPEPRDPGAGAPLRPGPDGPRLCILGWVQLERRTTDGSPARRPIALRGCQARAVVSMLALRPGPVHKDELAELLWPTDLPDHWEGALRGLITKVRRFLDEGGVCGREALIGEEGYYELRLPPDVSVDRREATTLMATAEDALAANQPAEAATAARQAVAILSGRLLSGQDHPWFQQIRAELTHERLAGLELWARAELEAGNTEGAKRAATEAVSLDPYRESSYRLLMLAHAAAGSRGAALRSYEQCRRMLADELGVGPSDQTQSLYIQLLG